jgi:catechol 2,3-dioxygenase-like lactoylglutathione lyase family enzyme
METRDNRAPSVPGPGRVRQIGIVVKSVPETVEFYTKLGIGPWFRPRLSAKEHFLGGERSVEFDLDLAIAFAGPVQYELIEHKAGDRNIYCDHLERYGEGIHHLGFYVGDFDRHLAAYRDAGVGVLQAGRLTSGGGAGGSVTKYAYLDTRQIGGVIIELIETRFLGININMSRFWFELGSLMGDAEKIRP